MSTGAAMSVLGHLILTVVLLVFYSVPTFTLQSVGETIYKLVLSAITTLYKCKHFTFD